MNPELVREATRIVQRMPDLTPQERHVLATTIRRANSVDDLPGWLRSRLRRAV